MLSGKIINLNYDEITIKLDDINQLDFSKLAGNVSLKIYDPRKISPQLRNSIYSVMRDISLHLNGTQDIEDIKEVLKYNFVNDIDKEFKTTFSLADCSIDVAKEYLQYVLNFCIEHAVPLSLPIWQVAADLGRYVYACAMYKRCCVCGRDAQLHHVDAIGMGNDRTEVEHIGREMLPLCERHHIEAHTIGKKSFMEKYILATIEIDEPLRKIYKLNKKKTK